MKFSLLINFNVITEPKTFLNLGLYLMSFAQFKLIL